MYTEQDYSNSLCHYGVKGQSWGNRRFQNLDGSYTPLGERHRLEQLARTGHIVRPGSASANREQLARTGSTVRVNTVSRPKAASKSVSRTASPTLSRTVYGATAGIQAARENANKQIAAAAKKKATAISKPTARIVDSTQAEQTTGTTKRKKKSNRSSSSDGTTTTGSKKRRSKSRKQKQQELETQQQEQNKQDNNIVDLDQKEAKDENYLSEEQLQDYAKRVIRGEFGNGQERKDKLGAKYDQIQALVNQMLKKGKKK